MEANVEGRELRFSAQTQFFAYGETSCNVFKCFSIVLWFLGQMENCDDINAIESCLNQTTFVNNEVTAKENEMKYADD